ncbi:MAG: hypothetical protein GC179_05945 [Anaerolineaceae bacterium]|nr:hypothetical protein [Anaerolineaceae bacterium]
MAETSTNYPDILGSITGGARYNVNVAQVALGLRPRNVRAGRAFEVILLIQNASDVDIDVTATLQLPPQDAKKKPKRFIAKSERLVVGLRPAEVGYVMLPVNSLPDTAIGEGYKVGVGIDVKAQGKPRRVRANEGGGHVNPEYLSADTVNTLNDLKKLSYSTNRRGLMGTVLEAPFNVMSAQIGQLVDLKPAWVSLWKVSDHHDDSLLLTQYAEKLQTLVLPNLKRETLYPPLYETTTQRFQQCGYDIQPPEAHYITKLLVYILELAAPDENALDYLKDPHFDVQLALKRVLRGEQDALSLPAWCKGMLKAIEANPTLATEQPAAALASTGYEELLRDAIRLGFQMITTSTGEKMGSEQDMQDYADKLIAKIRSGKPVLNFSDVYLPLLMGGVIIYDRAVLKAEKMGEMLTELSRILKSHYAEVNADDDMVYHLAEQVVDRALQKFGYRA